MDETLKTYNDSGPAIFLCLWLDLSKKSQKCESRPKEENVFY